MKLVKDKEDETINFLDMFAGIGGFRLGMEAAGHHCLGFCEIDRFARASYQAIHETKGELEWHDIRQITNEEWRELRGCVDVLCGGFPCQAFSLAGKRLGFEDTRGTLFFELARCAKEVQPRFLFFENVRGLLSHDKGQTFKTILTTLDELGYDVEWQVLNSKDFGLPQSRERVFLIGHSRAYSRHFLFPLRGKASSAALEKEGMTGRGIQVVGHLPGSFEQNTRVFSPKGLAPTLTTMSSTDKIPKIIQDEQGPTLKLREATKQGYASACEGDSVTLDYPTSSTYRGRIGHQIAHTLTTSGNQGVAVPSQDKEHQSQLTIRRLTPRECFRLQGFPDWTYDKAAAVNSKSQLYKQAGNSVSVPVIIAIAQRLKRIEELEVR
ncbi:DNA (cytosine-5-)-methyltransferase [Streptococcus sp. CM7]|jgi:DNA (cytosine-5)-methyltransferase 1|nr:DNA (cytosine-5-)-methyltransferase [Streptococcus sp. CM7]CNJ66487.1 prophage LambdaSa2%2C type II DNA modification methyltransferase [Streptococcus agalactiae]